MYCTIVLYCHAYIQLQISTKIEYFHSDFSNLMMLCILWIVEMIDVVRVCKFVFQNASSSRKQSHHHIDDDSDMDIKVIHSRSAHGKIWHMERTFNYASKRRLAGKVRSCRSMKYEVWCMDRWNFKNLKLMKVKASRKAKDISRLI